MPTSEFYKLTHAEFSYHVEAYNDRIQSDAERERNDRMTLTWLGAWLGRVEKMPSLNKFIGKDESKGINLAKDSEAAILAKLKAMTAQLGGTIVD